MVLALWLAPPFKGCELIMRKSFNFNDLYEEIKQEQNDNPDAKTVTDFYSHWGNPFTITGLKNAVEKEPDIPP